MANLEVEVAGLKFKNPIFLASAEPTENFDKMKLAIDAGAGAVVAKSYSPSEEMARNTNLAKYFVLDESRRPVYGRVPKLFTLYCRTGMVQAGEDEWIAELEKTQKYARSKGAEVIGSFGSGQPEDMARLAKKMEQAGLNMIEIDASCPHPDEMKDNVNVKLVRDTDVYVEVAQAASSAVKIPVMIKLTPQIPDVVKVARAVRDEGGAAGVTMTNRHLGFCVDIENARPFNWGWGGVGGPWMLPMTLRWISKTHLAIPDLHILGSNGAYDGEDAIRFMMSGAQAVEFCSVVMIKGYSVISKAIKELNDFMDRKGYASPSEMVGLAAKAALTYEQMWHEPGYFEVAEVDESGCTDCGKCLEVCWYNSMKQFEGYCQVDPATCKGCHNCKIICPSDCITMTPRTPQSASGAAD